MLPHKNTQIPQPFLLDQLCLEYVGTLGVDSISVLYYQPMSLGVVDLFNVESLHINDVHRHNIILESKDKDSGFEEPQVSSMRTVVA